MYLDIIVVNGERVLIGGGEVLGAKVRRAGRLIVSMLDFFKVVFGHFTCYTGFMQGISRVGRLELKEEFEALAARATYSASELKLRSNFKSGV